MSGLQIAANWTQIVRCWPAAEQHIVFFQLLVINAIAYAWGMVWALYLCWPVIVALRQITHRDPADRQTLLLRRLPSLFARTLQLGEFAAWICAVDWAFSGFVFPVCLQSRSAIATGAATIEYTHFLLAQTSCGLVAVTLTFFLVTWAALRACFPYLLAAATQPVKSDGALEASESNVAEILPWSGPAGLEGALVPDDRLSGGDAAQPVAADVRLRGLMQRVWWYFALAATVPLLTLAGRVACDLPPATITPLLVAGTVGCGLSLWLAIVIRRELTVLAKLLPAVGVASAAVAPVDRGQLERTTS